MTSVTKLIMTSTRKLTLASQNNSSDSLRVQVLISNFITRLEKVDSDSEDECTSHWWMQARKRALDPTPSFNEQKNCNNSNNSSSSSSSSGLKIRLVFNQQPKLQEDNDSSSDSEDDEDEFENENEEDMMTLERSSRKPIVSSSSHVITKNSCNSDSESDSDSDSDMEAEDDDDEEEKAVYKNPISVQQEEASSESDIDIDIGVEEPTFETPQIEADYDIHSQKSEEGDELDQEIHQTEEQKVIEEGNYSFEEESSTTIETINCCSQSLEVINDVCDDIQKVHHAAADPTSFQESIFNYSAMEDLSAWRNPGSLDPMMSPHDPKLTTPTKDLSLAFEIQVLQDKDDDSLECPSSPSLGLKEKRKREDNLVSDNYSPTKRSKSCCLNQDRISPLVLPTLSSVFTDA